MVSVFSIAFLAGLFCLVIKFLINLKNKWKGKRKDFSFGFFHPYCNAGGGGERVLWAAIKAVQEEYEDAHCIVYSGDAEPAEDILKTVEKRFNICLERPIRIIHLRTRFLVEAKYYPAFTLLLQSLGSVILGIEAICKFTPDVFIDTMGYAWTLPIFKLFGQCRVAAYVHFPTISTDMLQAVQDRRVAVNNKRFVSRSPFFSRLKLIYYRMFAYAYGLVGRRAEVVMVNSTWTRNHIVELWRKPNRTVTVYPPCDVGEFSGIPIGRSDGGKILSVAQFRPEKDHQLQVRAFHDFLGRIDSPESPVLVLVGSCRHEEDYQRVDSLKALCKELGIERKVEFKINLSFQEIIQEMTNASIALHTMRDEHFGIGIVECMSAGLVMIAHDSGGPKLDIVVDYNGQRTGFLASDVTSFADALETVWRTDSESLLEIRKNARESASRFSTQRFEEGFLSCLTDFIELKFC